MPRQNYIISLILIITRHLNQKFLLPGHLLMHLNRKLLLLGHLLFLDWLFPFLNPQFPMASVNRNLSLPCLLSAHQSVSPMFPLNIFWSIQKTSIVTASGTLPMTITSILFQPNSMKSLLHPITLPLPSLTKKLNSLFLPNFTTSLMFFHLPKSPPYHPYNISINLEDGTTPPFGLIYSLSLDKHKALSKHI